MKLQNLFNTFFLIFSLFKSDISFAMHKYKPFKPYVLQYAKYFQPVDNCCLTPSAKHSFDNLVKSFNYSPSVIKKYFDNDILPRLAFLSSKSGNSNLNKDKLICLEKSSLKIPELLIQKCALKNVSSCAIDQSIKLFELSEKEFFDIVSNVMFEDVISEILDVSAIKIISDLLIETFAHFLPVIKTLLHNPTSAERAFVFSIIREVKPPKLVDIKDESKKLNIDDKILAVYDFCWYVLRHENLFKSFFESINFEDEKSLITTKTSFFINIAFISIHSKINLFLKFINFFYEFRSFLSSVKHDGNKFDKDFSFLFFEIFFTFSQQNHQDKNYFIFDSEPMIKKAFFDLFSVYSCAPVLWKFLRPNLLPKYNLQVTPEEIVFSDLSITEESAFKKTHQKKKPKKPKKVFQSAQVDESNSGSDELVFLFEDNQFDVIEDNQEKDAIKACHWFADSTKKWRPQIKEMMKKFQSKFDHKLREEKIDPRFLFLGVEAVYLFLNGPHDLFFNKKNYSQELLVCESVGVALQNSENDDLFYLFVTGFAQIYASNAIEIYLNELGQKKVNINYEKLQNEFFLQGLKKFKIIIFKIYAEANFKICKQKFMSLISNLFGLFFINIEPSFLQSSCLNILLTRDC